MSDDQWAAQKLRELLERVRKSLICEYMRRSKELGLPWH